MQDRMIKHYNKLPLVTESRNIRSIGHHNFQPEFLDLFLIKRQVSIYKRRFDAKKLFSITNK